MRTQLVDFQGLASVEAVVSRLLLCYPLAVVRVCSVVVNVKFMVCMYEMQGKEEKGRREGVVFFFFSFCFDRFVGRTIRCRVFPLGLRGPPLVPKGVCEV